LETAELLSRIDAAKPWFHSIDLGNGIVTPGITPLAGAMQNAAIYCSHVKGHSVLDVGAWDGFYSFQAKRYGAKRVLAADHFCWGASGQGSKSGFDLSNEVLGLEIESRVIDIPDLIEANVGRFDTVLYNGIFYHYFDSLTPLRNLCQLCNYTLTLETLLDLRHLDRPAMTFFPGEIMAGQSRTQGWGANLRLLHDLLRYVGFIEIEYFPTPGHEKTRAILKAHKAAGIADPAHLLTQENVHRLSLELAA